MSSKTVRLFSGDTLGITRIRFDGENVKQLGALHSAKVKIISHQGDYAIFHQSSGSVMGQPVKARYSLCEIVLQQSSNKWTVSEIYCILSGKQSQKVLSAMRDDMAALATGRKFTPFYSIADQLLRDGWDVSDSNALHNKFTCDDNAIHVTRRTLTITCGAYGSIDLTVNDKLSVSYINGIIYAYRIAFKAGKSKGIEQGIKRNQADVRRVLGIN